MMKSCNLQLDIDKSITNRFNLSCAQVTLNNKKRGGGLEIPSQHIEEISPGLELGMLWKKERQRATASELIL
jgi:hypothetical protein